MRTELSASRKRGAAALSRMRKTPYSSGKGGFISFKSCTCYWNTQSVVASQAPPEEEAFCQRDACEGKRPPRIADVSECVSTRAGNEQDG
ncbi:hypothetical protein CesoFtcFv8_027433 [Champsocephalus esox]|uniref:Uncharacterized protein n=2 Tax=Champsocephalus TaxID=52236 RepID=A0AAN8GUS0_CHAGU|nr:hypothetical protein CesoFtcFv8_027433 [Champsocephalus esox]KAK5891112.1 hypothetical protein CgunFtcFv8_018401 [Champsocephalus gunnari]